MKIEQRCLSVERTVTVTEKRRVTIAFKDPLFPKQIITFTKTFTIKNGQLPDVDVYSFLDNRYRRKIGGYWKAYGMEDQGYGAKVIPVDQRGPIIIYGEKALSERAKLVKWRNNRARATARRANLVIVAALQKTVKPESNSLKYKKAK